MTTRECRYNHHPIDPAELKPAHEREWPLERRMHDPCCGDRGEIDGWCVDVPTTYAYEDGCRAPYVNTLFFNEDDEAQARLASAAPDMARALLAVRELVEDPDKTGDSWPTYVRDELVGMLENIDAALRKAGVR